MATKIFHHTEQLPRCTDLGGYPLVYTAFGANHRAPYIESILCCKCATEAKHTGEIPSNGGFLVSLDAFVHEEGAPIECEGCNEEIESAYGQTEEDTCVTE